ncbi:MAG: cation transporter [Dehalococcoidales bacterium]|nr:cation transporter [Dehalococcoidales bacterium]
MIETTLKIDGMMCDMCEAHVNQAVRNSIKIKKVSSSHKTGQAVILSEAPVDIEKVGKALGEFGYKILSVDTQEVEKKSFLKGLFGK